uniref:General transcription factor IIH subunit n=1 Tax=Trichuris muris TaxID=70415 RepID=A0A5S6QUB5_TRIMR
MDEAKSEETYCWEKAYEKPWEALKVDESGSLEASVINAAHENKRKELYRRKKNIRLGIMRQVCLVLDMSAAMNDRDLQPTRLLCTLKHMSNFLDDFFDQNPISQVCLLGVRDKKVTKLTEFASNPRKQKEALNEHLYDEGSGEFSLQNSLEKAISLLKDTPSHCIREVLAVVGSLGSCDPGDISSTIESLGAHKVVCNLIILSAEVFIYKKVAEATGGKHTVILDEADFKETLSFFVIPPAASTTMDCSLVRMGFPERVESKDRWSFCACHANPNNPNANLTRQGYFCPQCKSKYCSLPTECRVCGLILISAQHLARSHQHLFPVGTFTEVELPKERKSEIACYACLLPISVRAYTCVRCKNQFCIDCNLFIHQTLHVCPGC